MSTTSFSCSVRYCFSRFCSLQIRSVSLTASFVWPYRLVCAVKTFVKLKVTGARPAPLCAFPFRPFSPYRRRLATARLPPLRGKSSENCCSQSDAQLPTWVGFPSPYVLINYIARILVGQDVHRNFEIRFLPSEELPGQCQCLLGARLVSGVDHIQLGPRQGKRVFAI